MNDTEATTTGWRTIKVDPEVWKAVNDEAIPFEDRSPNDVLRRVFLAPSLPAAADTTTGGARRRGALRIALDKGTLVPGDILICAQPRKKRTFRAEVLADGWIKTLDPDAGEFEKVSPALAACTGGAINGWFNWVVERTGQKLEDYRY